MKTTTTLILMAFSIIAPIQAAEISLLDQDVKEYKVGFGDLWIGRTFDKRPVKVQGKEIQDYLMAHAPSSIKFDIPHGVTKFEAWGVRPEGDDNVFGSWIYIVKIDGKEVFRTKPLVEYETYEVRIDVKIPPGSKEIELVVDDMTNMYADHSIWALPVFK